MVRTSHSAAVICRAAPGVWYYRGLRFSDGATIELYGATPAGTGFTVTNRTDGTRYEVSLGGLSIISPGGQAYNEAAIESGP